MINNNTQIPAFVDFLQLSVAQEESWGEWLFLPSNFHNFAFLNIELHTVQHTPSFEIPKILLKQVKVLMRI